MNAFLFPAEARRVVGPAGVLEWVNTSGDKTPIHLSAEYVSARHGRGVGGVGLGGGPRDLGAALRRRQA